MDSQTLSGYRTRNLKLPAFDLTGFTKIVKSGGEQYDAVRNSSRWDLLRRIGDDHTIYGVASHDKECGKDFYRYTMAVKAPVERFGVPCPYDDLFTLHIKESDWLVFALDSFNKQYGKFWQDDPYAMLKKLGWAFNMRVGMHIDVMAPDFVSDDGYMEFWMPVRPPEPATA